MPLEARALGESDLDAVLDIRMRAFGPMTEEGSRRWFAVNREVVRDGRLFGVFDGRTLAGCGKARGFEQAWQGRLVPMAGMSGITVLPEYRGQGIGTMLMRRLAHASTERGEPVSVLYPATVPVYRNLGWEFAGAQCRYSLPARHLRVLGGRARVQRLGPGDAAAARQLTWQVLGAGCASGPTVWSEKEWRELLEDTRRLAYRCDDGLVVYGWDAADLRVELLLAASEETTRTLWSLVGSGSSVVENVHAFLAPDDPVFWLLAEEAGSTVRRHGWMLRVLDVEGALAARGYPAGLSAELTFAVDDRESDTNSDVFALHVAGGEGKVQRVEAAPSVRVTARGLAGLYAGRPVAALRRAGLLTSESLGDDALADAVFATSRPYLTEYF